MFYDNPVRVYTFGNDIEKLQIFNEEDQKTIDAPIFYTTGKTRLGYR